MGGSARFRDLVVARASHAQTGWSLSVILWTIVLAIMSAFQLWRGAYVDGGLFTAITVLLIVDTITGRRIKLLRSPVVAPRWVIALVVGALGIVLMIAPRHGVVDLVTMVVIGVAVFILGWAPARPRTPLPRQSYRRSAITWATLGVALCVWEALMFIFATVMPERADDFPTVSVLLDPFLEWLPGKIIFIALWLVAGLALLRVWSKR